MSRLLVLLLSVIVVVPCLGQDEHVRHEAEQLERTVATGKKGDFVIAPIPILNPTIGIGLAGGVAYLFQIDEGSYPSIIGGGGLYTDNGSRALGIAQSANFHANDWKVVIGAIAYDLDLEFYGVGPGAGDEDRFIPLNQSGWAAGAKGMRRISGGWYAGVSYFYVDVKSSFDLDEVPSDSPIAPPESAEHSSAIAALGLVAEYDTRDNQFSATHGNYITTSVSNASETVGSDFSFNSIHLSANAYHGLGEGLVIAGRVAGCAAPGEAPYYALCKFGVFPDLRGYVAGRYRDENMIAAQVELRWRFSERFSAVGFAGGGQVAPSISDFSFDGILPSFGGGLRYLLSPDNGLNIGIDYAIGKDSDATYFFVGESF